MSRIGRVVIPGFPYHVTQRGNGRQDVFGSDVDRRIYLKLLRRYSASYQLRIWAYCLMSNHIHLIVVPERATALARALGRTHCDYARYFNVQRHSSGHVWEARFFSCPLEGVHLWRAMAYVERNPVRASIVSRAENYRWSSAPGHMTGHDQAELVDDAAWRQEYSPAQWGEVLHTGVDEEAFRQRLQEATLRGRVMGSEEFLARLETIAGRQLRTNPPGRPRKKEAVSQVAEGQQRFENSL